MNEVRPQTIPIPYWPSHKIIMEVLEDAADKQINLGSETGREFLSEMITDSLWKHYHPNESLGGDDIEEESDL